MENFALVIAAILGTTGIASIANSLTVWGRRSKLRSSIKQMNEDLKFMDTTSAEYEACKSSLSVQALELASLSLIKMNSFAVWFTGMLSGSALLGFIFGATRSVLGRKRDLAEYLDAAASSPLLTVLMYLAIFPFVQFASIQLVMSRRRHRFVSEAWNTNCANREMILRHSSYLRHGMIRPKAAEKTSSTKSSKRFLSKLKRQSPTDGEQNS